MKLQFSHHAIRDIRISRGLSQAELAFSIGITQSHYSKFERGESCIGTKNLQELFEIMDFEFVPKTALHNQIELKQMVNLQKEQSDLLEKHLQLVDQLIAAYKSRAYHRNDPYFFP